MLNNKVTVQECNFHFMSIRRRRCIVAIMEVVNLNCMKVTADTQTRDNIVPNITAGDENILNVNKNKSGF